MSEQKMFTKKKLGATSSNITAVNIYERNLITGDDKGNIIIYQLKKSELKTIKKFKLESQIEKICISHDKKIAFILSAGNIFYISLLILDELKPFLQTNDIVMAFVNLDDENYFNALLGVHKNNKIEIKIYNYYILDEGRKLKVKEQHLNKELTVPSVPDCGIWTKKNIFVYSINHKTCCWLYCDSGKILSDDGVDTVLEFYYFDEKLAISNQQFSLYMWEGEASPLSMTLHENADFHSFNSFKNFRVVLYDKKVTFYYETPQNLEPVDSINFDKDETGKYMVSTGSKLIILTISENKKINFIDIQDGGFDGEIKILLDNKLYNESLDKITTFIPLNDEERQSEIENLYLDCAMVCLENMMKDYDNAFKYLRLTNFNPFEFIYMFCDALKIKIIHKDEENSINNNKAENQFFKPNEEEKKQNKGFEFLVSLLKIKRDYIYEKLIKANSYDQNKEITFMSSSRAKINLKYSDTKITIGIALEQIIICLLKCLIKLKSEPKEIENLFNHESLNYIKLENLDNDPFFSDEKYKNLEQIKLIKYCITEKYGNNYELDFKNWKDLGENKNEKFSLIGKERTKKLFYKLKEDNNVEIDEKEKLFKFYILWLLDKYPEEAFEIEKKTELVNLKVFMDEILPLAKTDNLKQKFLEYCVKLQKNGLYQTLLLELYINKLFELTGKDIKPKNIDGAAKNYYDLIMNIINSEDNLYNKKSILELIGNSWFIEAKVSIYAQLNEYNKAIEELYKEATRTLDFKLLEEFCKKYNDKVDDKLFEIFYKLLSVDVKKYQESIEKSKEKLNQLKKDLEKNEADKLKIEELEKEININEEMKKPLEKEMLEILKAYGTIENIDPLFALELANDHLNICKNKEFFNYLKKIVKDFTTEGNKYKIEKNLSDIGLAYKAKEEYDLKQKYVTIDSDRSCDLCKKKIGSTIFVVYPNLKVYHSKCAPNIHIDPSTGSDLTKQVLID